MLILQLTGKAKKIIVMALFCAVSIAIFFVETAIPLPISLPGLKLGLANIVTIIVLVKFGFTNALMVLLTRVILCQAFYGGINTFLYSLAGGLFALGAMFLVLKILKNKSVWFLGVIGALFHNLGQIIVAMFFYGTVNIMYYFLILAAFSIVTGVFTGIIAGICVKRIDVEYK